MTGNTYRLHRAMRLESGELPSALFSVLAVHHIAVDHAGWAVGEPALGSAGERRPRGDETWPAGTGLLHPDRCESNLLCLQINVQPFV